MSGTTSFSAGWPHIRGVRCGLSPPSSAAASWTATRALRMGVLECGFGWLPFWARRMDEQAVYVGGTAPLKLKPSEYLTSGRFFCSIERQEGEDMFNTVTQYLGGDVLMYASDYPHSECQFPESIDNILAWSSLRPDQRRKLFWDNANRFYKRT